MVSEVFLHLDQIDASFDQVGCIAVAQAVRSNLFLARTALPLARV